MTRTEPLFDVAHIGWVELLTPVLDESVRFFTDVMGMTVTDREGDSVYLRAFGDYERYTLKLTGADRNGSNMTAMRTTSEPALERRVEALQERGVEGRWIDGGPGRGRTWAFADPDGHPMALYYETEQYKAAERPALKNQPEKMAMRGVGVRRLDHVNFRCLDVAANATLMQEALGFRLSEQIIDEATDTQIGAWLHVTQKSYDLAYGGIDSDGIPGRLHHVAYAVDNREYVLRAADVFLDSGAFIEAGPAKHAVQQTFFLYVWEPGGNRIEIIADNRLIFARDLEPVTWTAEERKQGGQAWGTIMPDSWWHYATPATSDVPAGVR